MSEKTESEGTGGEETRGEKRPGLSHLDDAGRARMIDVGAKVVTRRVAIAGGRLSTTAEVLRLVAADSLPKADVLATARLAGIAAAKRTDELIPLAHSLPLDAVTVDFELGPDTVEIRATASVTGRTGVEMEALTAVAVAGLTLHDMIKAVDPAAVLGEVRLLEKSGGKRGHWTRAREREAEAISGLRRDAGAESRPGPRDTPTSDSPGPGRRAVVLVSSTRAAAGTRSDTTGPTIVEWLRDAGYAVEAPRVVADADLAPALAAAVAERPDVILTTGGTGVSPTDRTPEATRAVLDRELPGVAEALRAAGRASTPLAALSRGLAGVAGSALVVNLPGSTGGVRDGLAALAPLLPHLAAQLAGRDHEDGGHDPDRHDRGDRNGHHDHDHEAPRA